MFSKMYDEMVEKSSAMKKGLVYCHICKKEQKVDSAECLRKGWPKCCGSTMSLDEVRPRLETT
jgi:hypothetical protein